MEVIISRGCGLDVHQATVVACLLTGEPGALPRKQVKTFSAMTGSLIEMRDWLKTADCTAVAMEATGVYWKPVYNLLEGLSLPKTSSRLEILAVRWIISHSARSPGSSFFRWFASHLWLSSPLSFGSSGA